MRTLVVFYNPWVFALELAVLKSKEIEVTHVTVSRNYFNNGSQVSSNINWLKTHTTYTIVPYENLGDYDIIVVPTPGCVKEDELYKKYPTKKYIFVEEGISAYLDRELSEREKALLVLNEMYLTRPDKRTEGKPIDVNVAARIAMNFFVNELKSFPKNVKYVIFTEPVEHDNGNIYYADMLVNYVNNLPPDALVLLKRHPRDDTIYRFKHAVLEPERTIPAQLTYFMYPSATFVFTQYSTSLLLFPDKMNKEIIKAS